MSETRELTAALVGAGMVAGTHVAAARAAQGVRLKGVAARRPESARAFAEKIADEGGEALQVYEDAEAIAADPEVGFVIVTTPPNIRRQVIDPMVKAGKPVLLEKPVARSAKEAEEVVALCEHAGVPLGIVFQHRKRAASLKAAELIGSGELGSLIAAEITVPWWRDQGYYDEPGRGTYARDGGGVLISQAIHTLDLCLSLTGPVAEVQAIAATTSAHEMEAEDFVAGGLVFEGGAVGSLMATTASFPGGGEWIRLHHDKASLMLEGGTLKVSWRSGETESFGATGGSGGGADPMAFTHEWHQAVIEDFARAVREGRAPMCPGREALKVHQLIDALTRSAREGRKVSVT